MKALLLTHSFLVLSCLFVSCKKNASNGDDASTRAARPQASISEHREGEMKNEVVHPSTSTPAIDRKAPRNCLSSLKDLTSRPTFEGRKQQIMDLVRKASESEVYGLFMALGEWQEGKDERDSIVWHTFTKERTRGLSMDQLLSFLEPHRDTALTRAAVAVVANRSLESTSLDNALLWAKEVDKPFLANSIIESAAIGEKWKEVFDVPLHSEAWSKYSVTRVGITLGRKHPAEGFHWMEKRWTSHGDSIAVRAFVDGWVWTEPESASEWARNLPSGRFRDLAAESIVSYLVGQGDVDFAKQWSKVIDDPHTKKTTQMLTGELTGKALFQEIRARHAASDKASASK